MNTFDILTLHRYLQVIQYLASVVRPERSQSTMTRLPLTYTRPEYVSNEDFQKSHGSDSELDKSSLHSGQSGISKGIPPGLSFERVMGGQTCPVS